MNMLKNSNYEHYLVTHIQDKTEIHLVSLPRYMKCLKVKVYDVLTKEVFETNCNWLLEHLDELIGYFDDNDLLIRISILEYELTELLVLEDVATKPEYYLKYNHAPKIWANNLMPARGIAMGVSSNTIIGYFLVHFRDNFNCYILDKKRIQIFFGNKHDNNICCISYGIKDYTKFVKLITLMG